MTFAEQLAIDAAATKAVFYLFLIIAIAAVCGCVYLGWIYADKSRKFERTEKNGIAYKQRVSAELEKRDLRIVELSNDMSDFQFLTEQYRILQEKNKGLIESANRYKTERNKSDQRLIELMTEHAKVLENVSTITAHISI